MAIQPLREGRESIAAQAARRGSDVPVGSTVEELRNMGYDVDPDWPDYALLMQSDRSPTGYVVVVKMTFSWRTGEYEYALAY